VRDAEVEIAEEVLVDEIEPEPAMYVVLGGFRNYPVMVGKAQAFWMALGWVGKTDEDVPRRSNGEEEEKADNGMELPKALKSPMCASGKK
jgi:hypothetical protein